MPLTEIPRAAWTAALNEFSTQHEGWIVSVDIWTPEVGALPEIHDLPLVGVSADRNDVDGTVTITAATAPRGQVSHVIHGASSIAIEREQNGATAGLHVESSGGVKTSLRFRTPAVPELTGQ